MQSVHSSQMLDGDTHVHTDEDMPGLHVDESDHIPTPDSSQPSTPRNAEDKAFSQAFERIQAQQNQAREPEPLAPPFSTEVDATAMMDEMIDRQEPMFGDEYRRALGELEWALGFSEEMMILHLTEWQMLKELLLGSTVSARAQVLLLAGWRHRRDFVLSLQKALDEKQLEMSITWIQPLPPLEDIERTVQPSKVNPRTIDPRVVAAAVQQRSDNAEIGMTTPSSKGVDLRKQFGKIKPDGSKPASTDKVLGF